MSIDTRTFGSYFLLTTDEKEHLFRAIGAILGLRPSSIKTAWSKPLAAHHRHLLRTLLGIHLGPIPEDHVIVYTDTGWQLFSKENAERAGHGKVSHLPERPRARLLSDHFDPACKRYFIEKLAYALGINERRMATLWNKPLEDQYYRDGGIAKMQAGLGWSFVGSDPNIVLSWHGPSNRIIRVTREELSQRSTEAASDPEGK